MSDVIITYEETGSRGRYAARIEGLEGEAEMTLSKLSETRVIVDHTGVPDTMRGRGVAAALAERAIADARAAGRRIVPLCPFLKSYAQRHRVETADIVEL
ncbi:GNAT family N-acetyltransferase [Palleronia sp. LCG004]|uniref:GNAT family N-acetyltransferase n=1 Tax=Palleronia sp. LCG004 TaxID=3079304 RepID=UPI00294208DB|nr:GNAT family N-acetyltransferase [Palleronia sp. LCG004]WOI57667.1 GNAT family N-acetyltransferase [Palleronia sp. LCG004]